MFLFNLFCCLSKGGGEGKFSDVGMVISECSLVPLCSLLLSTDCSSIPEVGLLAGSQVSHKVSLFVHFQFIMSRDQGSNHVNLSNYPVNPGVILRQPRVS